MTPNIAEPPLGGSRAHILSVLPSLVPSEQRVAQLSLDTPETVALMSVADLAAATGTSPATVVRACKRLGFSGFQHLRQILLRDLGAAARDMATDNDMPSTGEPGSWQDLVSGIFGRAAQEIRGALGSLDFQEFAAAVEAIRSSRRLLVVANGASLPPAQALALNFRLTGIICEAPTDVLSQHISAKLLTPEDVCIAISDSGQNSYTLASARMAGEQGAVVIGVTSYGKSELAALSSHILVAGAEFHSWKDPLSMGNIVQLLILISLHAAVTSNSPEVEEARSAVLEEVFHIVDTSE